MKEDNYILIAVIIIVLCLFVFFIFYILYKSPDSDKIYLECPINECATSLSNGEKRCPENEGTVIVYDPETEVCNSKYSCENSLTKFALLNDGSTNNSGICNEGNICRCLQKPSCPSSNLVIFSLQNGNTQTNSSGNRVIFNQNIANMVGQNNNSITYNNSNTQFCLIKANHLDIISPNGCFFNNSSSITLDEMRNCLSSNPCLSGTIAFYPENTDNFIYNTNTIYSIPIGCFNAEINEINKKLDNYCNGLIPVYDVKTGGIICK